MIQLMYNAVRPKALAALGLFYKQVSPVGTHIQAILTATAYITRYESANISAFICDNTYYFLYWRFHEQPHVLALLLAFFRGMILYGMTVVILWQPWLSESLYDSGGPGYIVLCMTVGDLVM